MIRPTSAYGDYHNCGKRVHYLGDGRITKPRTVFWEWLLLSSESPLQELPVIGGVPNFFKSQIQINWQSRWLDGEVIEFPQINIGDNQQIDFESIGQTLAVVSFFGIGDLHWQNVFPVVENDMLSIVPIDIECIFHRLQVLSQTKIISDKRNSNSTSGLNTVVRRKIDIDELGMLSNAFCKTITGLDKHKLRITKVIESIIPTNQIPIRVITRPTTYYYDVLNSIQTGQSLNTIGLKRCEKLQLDRGDIPYFFHFPNDKRIYFLNNSLDVVESEFSQIPNIKLDIQTRTFSEFKVEQMAPRMIVSSMFQLARSYLRKYDTFTSCSFGGIQISADNTRLNVKFQNIEYTGML